MFNFTVGALVREQSGLKVPTRSAHGQPNGRYGRTNEETAKELCSTEFVVLRSCLFHVTAKRDLRITAIGFDLVLLETRTTWTDSSRWADAAKSLFVVVVSTLHDPTKPHHRPVGELRLSVT